MADENKIKSKKKYKKGKHFYEILRHIDIPKKANTVFKYQVWGDHCDSHCLHRPMSQKLSPQRLFLYFSVNENDNDNVPILIHENIHKV